MMLCLFLFALGLIDIFQTELLSWTKKQVKVVQNVELNVIVKKVEEKSSPEVITTNSERTALFTTPSKQETPTAYLNAGQKLNVQKVEGEWYGVKGPKQNILWLHKEQITPESDA